MIEARPLPELPSYMYALVIQEPLRSATIRLMEDIFGPPACEGLVVTQELVITIDTLLEETTLARNALRILAQRKRTPWMVGRGARVMRERYGFIGCRQRRPLRKVGNSIGVTTERVRQIEGTMLRLLRHPERSQFLKPFLPEWSMRAAAFKKDWQ
jgi:hypothetical protein